MSVLGKKSQVVCASAQGDKNAGGVLKPRDVLSKKNVGLTFVKPLRFLGPDVMPELFFHGSTTKLGEGAEIFSNYRTFSYHFSMISA